MVAILNASGVLDGLSTSLHLNPPEALWDAEGGAIMTAYEAVMLVLALVSIGIGIVSIMKK